MECINNGMTFTETYKFLNISKSSLYRYCKKEKIEFKSIGKIKVKIDSKSIELIKKHIENGCSSSMMALLIGVNHYVTRRIVKENNIVKKSDDFILNPLGRAKFSKDKKHLPLEKINELYILECNKIMNDIDSIKNNIYKNDYYEKYRSTDLTKEQVEELKNIYQHMTINEMTLKLNSNKTAVTRALYSNRLFCYNGYKMRKVINDKEFDADLANVNMSNTLLATKYGVSHGYINKERKRRFGEFKSVFNPHISRTSIEFYTENILKDLDITYYFQHKISKEMVDFYLGHKLIIECYGVYWHKNNEHDAIKQKKLEEEGYKILIIHEEEFDNLEIVAHKIKSFYFGSLYEEIRKDNLVNANKAVYNT